MQKSFYAVWTVLGVMLMLCALSFVVVLTEVRNTAWEIQEAINENLTPENIERILDLAEQQIEIDRLRLENNIKLGVIEF